KANMQPTELRSVAPSTREDSHSASHFLTVRLCSELAPFSPRLYSPFFQALKVSLLIPINKLKFNSVGRLEYLYHNSVYIPHILSINHISSLFTGLFLNRCLYIYLIIPVNRDGLLYILSSPSGRSPMYSSAKYFILFS